MSVFTFPPETYTILVVNPDAVLSGPVGVQRFQPVAWRDPQIPQLAGTVKLGQFSECHALNLRRQTVIPLT